MLKQDSFLMDSMSSFVSFSKIVNFKGMGKFRKKYPTLFSPDTQFALLEKCDGANFQFHVECDLEGKYIIYPFSRKRSLLDTNVFFKGWETVFEDMKPSIIRLSEILYKSNPETKVIRVYGELHGGIIQGNIYYSQRMQFKAFATTLDDIAVPISKMLHLYETCGVPYIPVLQVYSSNNGLRVWDDNDEKKDPKVAIGSLDQLMQVSPVFISTLSDNDKKLRGPNIAEGYILTVYSKSTTYGENNNNCRFKNKHPRFNEWNSQKNGTVKNINAKRKVINNKNKRKNQTLSPEDEKMIQQCVEFAESNMNVQLTNLLKTIPFDKRVIQNIKIIADRLIDMIIQNFQHEINDILTRKVKQELIYMSIQTVKPYLMTKEEKILYDVLRSGITLERFRHIISHGNDIKVSKDNAETLTILLLNDIYEEVSSQLSESECKMFCDNNKLLPQFIKKMSLFLKDDAINCVCNSIDNLNSK